MPHSCMVSSPQGWFSPLTPGQGSWHVALLPKSGRCCHGQPAVAAAIFQQISCNSHVFPLQRTVMLFISIRCAVCWCVVFFFLPIWCLHLILYLTSWFLVLICQPKWQIPASDLCLLLIFCSRSQVSFLIFKVLLCLSPVTCVL